MKNYPENNSRKRVAFHFATLAQGGVERMRIVLAEEFMKNNIDVDFVLCRAEGPLLASVPPGVRIINLNVRRSMNSLPGLIGYLKREAPDVMVASLPHQNISSIIAKRLSGARTRVFVTFHNAMSEEGNAKNGSFIRLIPHVYKVLLPLADGVIAVSQGVARDLQERTGISKGMVEVLYNPAFPSNLVERAGEPVMDPVFDESSPLLISVGRLHPQKGYDTLLAAFARARNLINCRLAICGEGAELGRLQQLAVELGVETYVNFLGFQENPLKYINRSSRFVMSSRYEGFGNVLVEALACGKPVISTNCNYGPSEIIDDPKYGILVPVDDIDSLSDAIVQSIKTEYDAEVLKKRAMEFSSELVAMKYLDVLGLRKNLQRGG